MNVLDLFSGIGGFSLGLERAGFRTVAFCEIEPFCRRILAKHWPHVPCYDDVRTLTADRLRTDGISVDVICGGFPCQDISVAGKGAGLAGERSGLWREYSRLISEVGPRYVIVENVSALLGRGLGDVLGDLAALGYDAEWHCIPASAVGAPHRRDRIWIVGHAAGKRCTAIRMDVGQEWKAHSDADRAGQDVSDADIPRLAIWQSVASHDGEEQQTSIGAGWWPPEPGVGRVVDGSADRVDRLRALGNAVVPQIPELIGRAIMAAENVQ